MDIYVQRDALLKPLQAVSGVVEKKQTLPILSNILLSIDDQQLKITGTDLEIELTVVVPIDELLASGTTTVAARKLFDICRALPEGSSLRLTLDTSCLIVKAGDSSFKLNTLSPSDFPSLEAMTYPIALPIKQHQLKNLFSKTHFAMGQQDVRPYLNGTLLDIDQQSITAVAADGHRMALALLKDEQIGDLNAHVIIPRKSVLELIRLLDTEKEQYAMLHIADNRIQVITDEFIFTSKLINAQYPDYKRLLPRGTIAALGDAEAIRQALTRAAILSNEKFRVIRFQLEENKLCITANNSDQELAEEALAIDYSGQSMEIGFNVAYLLDVVLSIANVAKSKGIRFLFTDANNGVLIEPTDNEACQYVVMPMRL